jgi:hypothetical protein
MPAASGLTRNADAAAISSGRISLPIGTRAASRR